MLVKGIYKTFTFGKYLRTFDEGNISGYEYLRDTSNISSNTRGFEKAYSYRESLMNAQTPENAAKTLINSSKIGFGGSSKSSKGYDKATGYINSRLNSMSPDQAFKYLSGK
jgi:hypothetical protein